MKEKAPLPSAVVVPKEVLPLKTSTVLFASAVPVIVGVESLAAEEVDKDVGALGTVVSIINALFAPKEPEAPSDAKVRVALFPEASFIVPLFNDSPLDV